MPLRKIDMAEADSGAEGGAPDSGDLFEDFIDDDKL
jgi:hypothetical protein